MPVQITAVAPDSLAEELGWKPGDQIVSVNDEVVEDELDFRFKAAEENLALKVRLGGSLQLQHVEKAFDEGFGVELEEFRIKTCGDDCVFCFVDQNPLGLRETLYFRDGDFRLSFLYGNYVTVTNLRERDLARIVAQRLSPLYISVHCTDNDIRRAMMGHRTQDDRLNEKLRFFHDHDIEMHAQIVLVPGYNDGGALVQTILDLYKLHEKLFSVSIVPVGLTGHRRKLTNLRTVASREAQQLVHLTRRWQRFFRKEIGRGFVYLGDEMYLLAGEPFPPEEAYDGYPLMENGVGMCRDFLNELDYQRDSLPARLSTPRRLTLATGTLAAPLLQQNVAPVLSNVEELSVEVAATENVLFGDSVTVSGLLGYRSFVQRLRPLCESGTLGDLVLLPPDSVNVDGKFLDEAPGSATPDDLARELGTQVEVFGGDWVDVVERLDR